MERFLLVAAHCRNCARVSDGDFGHLGAGATPAVHNGAGGDELDEADDMELPATPPEEYVDDGAFEL